MLLSAFDHLSNGRPIDRLSQTGDDVADRPGLVVLHGMAWDVGGDKVISGLQVLSGVDHPDVAVTDGHDQMRVVRTGRLGRFQNGKVTAQDVGAILP